MLFFFFFLFLKCTTVYKTWSNKAIPWGGGKFCMYVVSLLFLSVALFRTSTVVPSPAIVQVSMLQ